MRWNHHFRVSLIILLSVILISAAVIFSVLRAALPYATGYKVEIQQEISRQIGLPVEIGSIDAAIHWFSPRLKLLNVSVFDKAHKLHIFDFKEAFVELDTTASLLRGELIVGNVGLIGTKISIEKLSDKDWLVQGIKFSSEGKNELPEQLLYMLKNSDYLLHDSDIYYQDHTGDKLNISLLDVNVNVVNRFNTHNIKISTNLPDEYGKDIAIVANLKGDFDSLYGDIYVEANAVDVNQWNNKFKFLKNYELDSIVDVAVWSTLQGNEISQLTTHFSASDFSIQNSVTNKYWKTNFLTADIDYVLAGRNRQLSISNFYFGDESQEKWGRPINVLSSEDKNNYYFNADFIHLSDLHDIAEVVFDGDVLGKDISEQYNKIKDYGLQGDIYNLSLRLAKQELVQKLIKEKPLESSSVDMQVATVQEVGPQEVEDSETKQYNIESDNAHLVETSTVDVKDFLARLYVDATIYDFSMRDEVNKFSVEGIDVVIHHENNVANVSFFTNDAVVELNKLFRNPLVADVILGDVFFTFSDNEKTVSSWELDSEKLQIKNQDINTFTRLNLQSVAKGPIKADVQTDFYNAAIKSTHKYLPVGIMKKGLVSWLDSAVTNGYVPSGQFILNGDLNDFPYRENNGVFQVLFSAKNFDMKYLGDWPVLKNTSAKLKFNSMSLDVTDVKSTTKNASLYAGSARIKNLTDAYINVIANVRGSNENIQSYIWSSPLDKKLGDTMRLFQLGGNSDLSLKIGIPLQNKDGDVRVDGRLVFDNAEIYYPEMSYSINQINGTLDFTNDTIFSDSIEAYIEGNPVLLSANTHLTDSGQEISFHLDGVINADYLLRHYKWVPDNWLSGSSFWSIDFELPADRDSELLRIDASSSLDNVVVNVSDAVHKKTGEELELNAKVKVLKNNKLTIDVKALDTKENNVKEKTFEFYAKLNENKVWNIDVESDYLEGIAEFSSGLDQNSQITLDLDKINLSALLVADKVGAGEGKTKKSLKPTDFPSLDWKAKSVIWDDWAFTGAILKTDWNQYGMLINTFVLNATAFAFDGTGSWLISSDKSSEASSQMSHETVLKGKITSGNIGDALTAFGYERSLNRSGFDSEFTIKWPAEPYALTWDAIKGDASFDMRDGEILEVEPGAGGRLLGLMNIFKLTNRLAFNFGDVYRKGFSFDSIKGGIEFSGGHGSLKKFDISAPAADINMFGNIGLVKRDFNLLMHVKPHTDTLTFAGGVLVGGVVVGAGLALLQKIFDLGVIGHSVYSITGSWSDPITEEIVEKTQSTSEDDELDEL